MCCSPRLFSYSRGKQPFRAVSYRAAAYRGTFEYVLGDNSIYRAYMRIHLMTIKVFTTPRRTRHFEIWRLGSPAYTASQRRYPNPVVHPLLSFSIPFPFPPSLSSRFLFHIPFPVSRTYTCIRVRRSVARWRATFRLPPSPSFTAVFHIIYNPRPARRPRNNSVRIHERRASASPNWWKPRTS